MAHTTVKKRILAFVAALLLVLTVIGSTTLASHHLHDLDHDHDEGLCTICQLIQATMSTLRNTNSIPMSAWGIFMVFLPLALIGATFGHNTTHSTLVRHKIRCNN